MSDLIKISILIWELSIPSLIAHSADHEAQAQFDMFYTWQKTVM